MVMNKQERNWRRWLSIDKIAPLLTVVAGGFFLLQSFIGTEPSSAAAQNMIIALLTLLALDSLTERVKTVEDLRKQVNETRTALETALDKTHGQLQKEINEIPSRTVLGTRDDIELATRIEKAHVISIAAVSCINLLTFQRKHFETYLRRPGMKLQFLLTDPQSPALEFHHAMDDKLDKHPAVNIQDAQQVIATLQAIASEHESVCELRFTNVVLPFSMIIMQRHLDSDIMFVEMRTYKIPYGERPLFTLRRSNEGTWYKFYEEQFLLAWNEAHERPE